MSSEHWSPAVPRKSLHPVHAPSTPVTVCPVNQAPDRLVPVEILASGFDDACFLTTRRRRVGIEVRRACILVYGYSSGFPLDLSPAPIMLTFPQASLRSRAAGFPRLGSDLGIALQAFPTAVKLKCWHTYTPPSPVCFAGWSLWWLIPVSQLTDPVTAKRPEPLCPMSALP